MGSSSAGAGITVGHLDTGVDPAADPRLAGRVDAFLHVDRDGLGAREGSCTDGSGHGTTTARLVLDAAPEITLRCASVLEDGNILARILLGLDWLARGGVAVVCLPLGLPVGASAAVSPMLRPVIRELLRRDAVVVAAIGNGGAGTACVPAAHPEVLSVGSAGPDGRVVAFSGSRNDPDGTCRAPHLVAPGVDVELGGEPRSGTSVSAALVAGTVAVLRAAVPHATGAAVRAALLGSAQPPAPEQRHRVRHGGVRPDRALELLREHPDVAPTAVAPPERGYVDPRLRARLARARPDAQVDAVVELDGFAAARRFARRPGVERARLLASVPTVVVRASPGVLEEVLDGPGLVAACAADVDRSLWFGRR